MASYTLTDFNDIRFSGLSYVLPEQVINNIKRLAINLGVQTNTNTNTNTQPSSNTNTLATTSRSFPLSRRGGRKGTSSGSSNKELSNEDWENLRNFKATKMDVKEGIEKTISDIRAALNKLTDKNYVLQRDVIFNHIATLDESNYNMLTDAIFEIASTNKFYSEIYAQFYRELTDQYPFFKEAVPTFLSTFKTGISAIKYVDADTDFNAFCDNNKENDRRKAASAFLVNLAKVGLLLPESIVEVIEFLLDAVFDYMDQENRSYELEEIVENIFILTTLSKEVSCLQRIKCFSQLKAKEHSSLTSRAVFKMMDIIDFMKKNGITLTV
jgi:hypothetical protein